MESRREWKTSLIEIISIIIIIPSELKTIFIASMQIIPESKAIHWAAGDVCLAARHLETIQ